MRTINKIYLLCIMAVLLAFTACEDDILREPSPEDSATGAQAYFPETNKTSLSFSPSDATTFTIEIGRRKFEQAGVVEYTIEDKEGVFVLDNSVSFEAGEKIKEIEVDFSAMELGMNATLVLKIKPDDVTLYGASSLSVSVLRDYVWVDRGTVEFTEDDFGLGTATVSIQMAQGTQLFRLKDLYSVLTTNDDDPVSAGYHLTFYLDTINNWAADQISEGFQDLGTGYELYYVTTGNLAAYCTFTNRDNVYSAKYLLTPDGNSLYLGSFSFVWSEGFPLEIPDPYEGDAAVNVDWIMASADVSYWGYENYSYDGMDEYGNPKPVYVDEFEIKLTNVNDFIVLSLLASDTGEEIKLPTGTFDISASNKENTVRAGYKSGDPIGSYVQVSSVNATLYLTEGTITIEENGGVYTITLEALSAKGADVKATWSGTVIVKDETE